MGELSDHAVGASFTLARLDRMVPTGKSWLMPCLSGCRHFLFRPSKPCLRFLLKKAHLGPDDKIPEFPSTYGARWKRDKPTGNTYYIIVVEPPEVACRRGMSALIIFSYLQASHMLSSKWISAIGNHIHDPCRGHG